ncbi:MAG: cupredoxin domain-containing protein [Candidatus Caldarchaeum sp.]
MSEKGSRLYVGLATAAIVISLIVAAQAVLSLSQTQARQDEIAKQVSGVLDKLAAAEARLNDLAKQIGEIRTRTEPKLQKLTILLGEGKIVQEAVKDPATGEIKLLPEEKGGEEELTGEYHRWEPAVIIVKKGDTVELTVKNPRKHAHSFVLPAFGVDTGRIPGRAEQPDEAKRTVTVRFVADKAGVFQFQCGVPFDHEKGDCDADHNYMVGYLIVLD